MHSSSQQQQQQQHSAIEDSLRSIRFYFLQISTQLFVILCRLIDQGGSVAIKGKALLTIELICRYQPSLLSSLGEHRLQHILTKLFDSNQSSSTLPSSGQDPHNPNGPPSSSSPYVSQCVQSFISWIQFLLSHSVLEMIQELKNFTHLTTPRGGGNGEGGGKRDQLPPPPPPEDHPSNLLTTPSKGMNSNPLVTPVKSPRSGNGSGIKQSKSTPLLTAKIAMSPSLASPAPAPPSSAATGNVTSIAILRGCISLISHPSLQKHVITSKYLFTISTALQLISENLAERRGASQYQSPQRPSEDQEFLVLSEQSILLALESVSQVSPWSLPSLLQPSCSHRIPCHIPSLRSTSLTPLLTHVS
jgi:hypothetical protein